MFDLSQFMQMVPLFKRFSQSFSGDPKQQVQQMLNSGQMSQEQLNTILPMAQQFYGLLHNNK